MPWPRAQRAKAQLYKCKCAIDVVILVRRQEGAIHGLALGRKGAPSGPKPGGALFFYCLPWNCLTPLPQPPVIGTGCSQQCHLRRLLKLRLGYRGLSPSFSPSQSSLTCTLKLGSTRCPKELWDLCPCAPSCRTAARQAYHSY